MPPREGNTSLNVSLPKDLVARLDVLAATPGASKSTVVEAAVRQFVDQGANASLVTAVHQRLDTQGARLQALEQALTALEATISDLGALLTRQAKAHDALIEARNLFCDFVDGARGTALPAGSRLKQFWRAWR